MSEHVCDWMIKENPRSPLPMIVCTHPKCHGRLLIEEAEAMLNEHAALKRRIEVWWSRWNVAHSILDTTQLRQYEEEMALLADTQESK